jgi:hypothetical protein
MPAEAGELIIATSISTKNLIHTLITCHDIEGGKTGGKNFVNRTQTRQWSPETA